MATFKRDDSVNLMWKGKRVARGLVVQTSTKEKLHGAQLPSSAIGVSVLNVFDPNIPLPFIPAIDDDITILRHAKNTTIAWPVKDVVRKSQNVSYFIY